MIKTDLVYLEHIIGSLKKAMEYIHDVSFETFLFDEEKQDAVIRKLEIAGEATKKVSAQLKEKNVDIPWRAMAGMRDKLIHDYFEVDTELVWETLKEDIPSILPKLEAIHNEISQ